MKKLIGKIGLDKIAHHGIGAEICAFLVVFGLVDLSAITAWEILMIWLISAVVVFALSALKEAIDKKSTGWNWWDIIAGMSGTLVILFVIIIGIILRL